MLWISLQLPLAPAARVQRQPWVEVLGEYVKPELACLFERKVADRILSPTCTCVGVCVCACGCGCGCVGVWVCGCVGVWVCGCVFPGALKKSLLSFQVEATLLGGW